MENRMQARLTMSHKTDNLMNRRKSLWEKDPNIPGVMETINNYFNEISKTQEILETETQSYTEHKRVIREKINFFLDILFAAIRAFAMLTNDDVLYGNYDVSLTKIRDVPDTEILAFFNKHMDYATAHLSDLEPYGIREAGLKEAQANMDEYQQIFTSPQTIRAIKASANAKLKVQVDELVNVFDEILDNLMERFRIETPDFYDEYLQARVIYDLPTHHKALHGKVTDEETKEPLEHVKVTFMHTGEETNPDDKLPTTYTTAKGNYSFKTLPPGTGTVIFEKGYYDTLHMKVDLIENKDYLLNVAIRKTE